MSPLSSFTTGKGIGRRLSHVPPVSAPTLQVQAVGIQLPHYPFQPLPTPNGPPPYRFDLSQLLSAADITAIANGTLIFHTVGDTGDHRGQQQDFVAEMMTQDAQSLPLTGSPLSSITSEMWCTSQATSACTATISTRPIKTIPVSSLRFLETMTASPTIRRTVRWIRTKAR